MTYRQYSGAAVLAVSLLALGCGGEKLPPMFPVKGKVTLDGKPLADGHVALIPTSAENKVGLSAGEIENGEYSIFTAGKEGAPLGKYKVTVSPSMAMPMASPKGPPKPPFNLKYSSTQSTPLSIDVVENPAPGAYDLKIKK